MLDNVIPFQIFDIIRFADNFVFLVTCQMLTVQLGEGHAVLSWLLSPADHAHVFVLQPHVGHVQLGRIPIQQVAFRHRPCESE